MSDPLPPASAPAPISAPSALAHGLWRCESCGHLARARQQPGVHWRCPCCDGVLHARRPDPLSRSWAFLLAATALYLPANLLPVTSTASPLGAQSDTILSGIVFLWQEGSWALAIIVFIASIAVPMSKLLVLSFLLLSVHLRAHHGTLLRLKLYQTLELVGRWSMLDVFVITVLAALVQIESLASLRPGPGAVAFGAVVVLTALATRSFDSRLIFDAAGILRGATKEPALRREHSS